MCRSMAFILLITAIFSSLMTMLIMECLIFGTQVMEGEYKLSKLSSDFNILVRVHTWACPQTHMHIIHRRKKRQIKIKCKIK